MGEQQKAEKIVDIRVENPQLYYYSVLVASLRFDDL